jgi:hypothetical protein
VASEEEPAPLAKGKNDVSYAKEVLMCSIAVKRMRRMMLKPSV